MRFALLLTFAAAVAYASLCGVAPARACAQAPELPIPTLGPVDPTCSRVPDTDLDGVMDYEDNCQRLFNATQLDTDKDSGPPPYEPVPVTFRDPTTGGDACDVDDDADGINDVKDTCPKIPDKDQTDTDGDGQGDPCDPIPGTPSAGGGGVSLKLGKVARRYRSAELRAGLAVPVRCSTACALTGRLRAGRTTLGSGAGGLAGAGSTFVFVKLSSTGRKRVAHTRKRLRAVVSVAASDDVGHKATRSRKLTLQR